MGKIVASSSSEQGLEQVYLLPTARAREKEPMELNETLHNCLMAVASRYPQYSVNIDEDVWGQTRMKLHADTPRELLEHLQIGAPQFLHVAAHVKCDATRCEIYVADLSEERAAFRFHVPRLALLS